MYYGIIMTVDCSMSRCITNIFVFIVFVRLSCGEKEGWGWDDNNNNNNKMIK